jgi:PAS domain S-box-containing protein
MAGPGCVPSGVRRKEAIMAETEPGAVVQEADSSARQRADALLRQQATLLALAHDAVILRAPDGRILTWNDGAAALYGWTAAEALGRTTHDLLHTRLLPSGAPGTLTDALVASQGAWEGMLEHLRRDGTRVVVESQQALLRAAEGTPEAILEINRDLAVHLEMEATLARLQALQCVTDAALGRLEQPALLRQLLERIVVALGVDNAAILLLDETGRDLVVHAARGPEEAQIGQVRAPVGQGVAGQIAATRQPLIVTDLRSVAPVNPLLRQMASLMGVPLLVEDRLIGVMHVDAATPRQFTDDDLQLLQLVADRVALALENAQLYQQAVAARDRAEELARQVQAQRDRLERVLDLLPVGVVITDAHGAVETLNQAGMAIVGLDTRGQSLPNPGDERAGAYRIRRPDGTPYPPAEVPLARSLRTGGEVRDDLQLHRHAQTGQETPLLVNSTPLRDDEGRITGAVAVFQDISALRTLEQAREAFLAAVAHDLKNPLTTVRGQAQLAARRLAGSTVESAPVLTLLRGIQQGTATMLGLINELLDVTRLQMGQVLDLQRQPTDLVALVRDCVHAHGEASGRPIHLETALPALDVAVDAARIERVLGNLLANALKYSPPESPIWVCIAPAEDPNGRAVQIVVRDEGIGIPSTDLPHIFDHFRRASNVVGYTSGTGIGLASARGIVEQHGGTISVESMEGAGATFTVQLPLTPPSDGS